MHAAQVPHPSASSYTAASSVQSLKRSHPGRATSSNTSLGKAVQVIEKETRGQRDNPKWHEWRQNRITASVTNKITNSHFVNHKTSEVPQSYLKAVVGQAPVIQTWGICNEKREVQEYAHLKSRNSRGGVKVEDCGIFIHPKKTWLAASPDGIVKNNSTGKPIGLLEVKCPYKHKDQTIREACKDDKFCLTPAGNSNTLKKDHPYYTQVQTLMAATGVKKTDFVVYTKKETTIAPVKFDAKFWKATEPKLETFYNDVIVPHEENKNHSA
ncbi:hypothetical protein NDU88_002339 [Pleurodeles waltl]|uniref:YqaJ viral recombinase domain-containing protein n=1 Tax=Pleurodeles waltl TaxID=8319 RepID=A0AAV7VA90_PLEWA|nr:hypothetical protein NDU88_002339 [Pleurodeles waltl]